MIDLGTGNNNKINWTMEDKQEMIDIIETVYRGARKGRGLVVSPKDYSTKYRYWFLFFWFFFYSDILWRDTDKNNMDIKEGLFLKKNNFFVDNKTGQYSSTFMHVLLCAICGYYF